MDKRATMGSTGEHISSPMNVSPDHIDFCYSSLPYVEHPHSGESFFFHPIPSSFAAGIESYLDPKYISDPASFASRLPFLPLPNSYAMYDWGFEPAFIRKRNERERQRVKCVNEGYTRLREHLPREFAEKRLSKVETLRAAIQYIKQLQRILGLDTNNEIEHSTNSYPRNKMQDTSDSDQDRASDETYHEKYPDDDSELTPTTISSRDDRLSTLSGENEDMLTSGFSPRIKVEVPSPSSSFAVDGPGDNCVQKSGEFLFKGKIFCKSSLEVLQQPKDKTSFENYQSSCCWVGNESVSNLQQMNPYCSFKYRKEKKDIQHTFSTTNSFEKNSAISCNYNTAIDYRNFKNMNRPSSNNCDCLSNRKRPASNSPLWQKSDSESCFYREKLVKQASHPSTDDKCVFNENKKRNDSNNLKLNGSSCATTKEP